MPAPLNWRSSVWMKTVAVLLVLLVGILAVRHSTGLALAAKRPELALRLDGENALVQAEAALALVKSQPDADSRRKARALALGALQRDPGNVDALAALGMSSDNPKQVTAAFTAAERLSRRNLITQLWMIENAVAKEDVASALRHYDIALRTSRSAPAILFPVLVNATTDDALLPEIARTLARRPLWGGLYLQQLAQSGPDRGRIARLFATLKRQGIATGLAADSALYDRLLEAQLFEQAWAVYAADHPGASRDMIRNGLFAEEVVNPTPFDWQLSDNEFVNARTEQVSASKGQLVFTTSAGEGGEVAKQMLVLAPGTYTAEVGVSRIDAPDAAAPYLRMTCLPSGAELLRKPLALQGMSGAPFSVPAGCPAQTLVLMVQPAGGLAAVTGTVHVIRVNRTR